MSKKFSHIYSYLKKTLPKERLCHVMCVVQMARKLALKHGEDSERAELASALHDVARRWNEKELIGYAQRHSLKIPDKEFMFKFQPVLLHSFVGADIARKKFHVKDKEILSAIEKHSLGDTKMSKFEKLIYLADLISLDRKFSECIPLRKLAFEDIEKAFIKGIAVKIQHVIENQQTIHPLTVKVWNKFLTVSSIGFKKPLRTQHSLKVEFAAGARPLGRAPF